MKQQQLQEKPSRGQKFDLRLPPELHRELKIQSARQGISMNEYVTAAIREKIDRETK